VSDLRRRTRPALLEIRDGWRRVFAFWMPSAAEDAGLAGTRPGFFVDHHEYRELGGAQIECRQCVIEVRDEHALRAPQCVSYVAAEWCHCHGGMVPGRATKNST